MEYVVIGAGPAGLRAGHFLQRAGWEYVVRYTGAFIHGFGYGIRALVHLLERIDHMSALVQQDGFMCDAIAPDGRYHEEMPLDCVPFRARRDGEVLTTLRLPEAIDNDWTDDRLFREPLQRFMKESL